MKKVNLILTALMMVLLAFIFSCDKNKSESQPLSREAAKFLELKTRMNAVNAGSGQMSDFLSVIGRSQLKEGDLNITGTNVDSAYVDSISVDPGGYWGNFTCATVTESDNSDGTHTTVYDYGSGCDEYGSMFRGKLTYIWSNTGNDYFSKVIYENYYCFGVTMNGMSQYSFTSDGNSWYGAGGKETGSSGDSIAVSVPVIFNWSGTSTARENITMLYDDSSKYSYSSDYINKWDSAAYKVIQGSYHYKSESAGNKVEYSYDVTSPLVTSYKCTESWVPVSGVETITDTENDVTNTYSVDYGNGKCDNLAVLTENGKTSVVDFSQIYYQKVDSSGTVSPAIPMKLRK